LSQNVKELYFSVKDFHFRTGSKFSGKLTLARIHIRMEHSPVEADYGTTQLAWRSLRSHCTHLVGRGTRTQYLL